MKMLSLRKVTQWTIAFSLLSLLTISIVSSVTGYNLQGVYAQNVLNNPAFNSLNNRYVVTTPAQEIHDRVFERIINRFQNLLNKQQELCEVNEEQYQQLSEKFDLTVKDVQVDGETVSIVEGSSGISKRQLQQELATQNVHCKLVEVYGRVILQLGGHLS